MNKELKKASVLVATIALGVLLTGCMSMGTQALILGPIGLIWVLVTAKDTSALEAQSLSTGKHKKCPFCAEVIKKEASVCKHCGGQQPSAATPSQSQTYWVCGKCNETTETAKNTCWSCGSPKV